jgi:pimeloyl-ACP methyl ester carboxylesterase
MNTMDGRSRFEATRPKLIFVPGADCQVIEDYPKTYRALKEVGFDITAISPAWSDRISFENLVNQISQEVTSHIGQKALLVAHSRGANLVMPALAQQPNIGVVLASPSVACAEGYENNESRALAEARFPDQEDQVRRIGMFALARNARLPADQTAVLVGGEEIETYPFMDDIAGAAARGFGVNVTYVPGAPHFIDYHDTYIDAVVDATVRINLSIGN